VQRAFHAHLNHWEAFAQFGVATLLALLNDKETHELTVLTNGFLFLRVLFTVLHLSPYVPAMTRVCCVVL
jgi:uncharacterized MAPEG superfamily protein